MRYNEVITTIVPSAKQGAEALVYTTVLRVLYCILFKTNYLSVDNYSLLLVQIIITFKYENLQR